jgi:2-polyprenyl-3-methyl-5-hydroxy-6-metoxy-1,4-benzoquinol methylase
MSVSSCCVHNRDAGRFFGWFAKRYRKRFARKGFEPSQKQLFEGLIKSGINGATLLEIGCGVGYLHQRLLQAGAASATGIDLSSKMLDEARVEARALGLSERTIYREGDFVELADSISPADVVVLDKVICCYPDADSLVNRSAAKATSAYAFTVPRNRIAVRAAMAISGFILKLIRCGFRAYVHDPAVIDRWLTDASFERTFENCTLVWLTRVYTRRAPS